MTKDKIDGPAKQSVQRGVLGSMTVRNVKNLVQKLLRVPAMRQELSFFAEDPHYAGVMVSTGEKERNLYFFFFKKVVRVCSTSKESDLYFF